MLFFGFLLSYDNLLMVSYDNLLMVQQLLDIVVHSTSQISGLNRVPINLMAAGGVVINEAL